MPDGVTPGIIAGNMATQKRDNFGNHYEQVPQGNPTNKNKSRVFSHLDQGLDQVYSNHKENNQYAVIRSQTKPESQLPPPRSTQIEGPSLAEMQAKKRQDDLDTLMNRKAEIEK